MNRTPLELLVDAVGHDAYARRWHSLPWYSRLWWTIRGFHPGGRKGAPPLGEQA